MDIKKEFEIFLYSSLKSFVKAQLPEIALSTDAAKTLAIKALVHSKSWQKTHDAIAELSTHISDISGDEAIALFKALINNWDINTISKDSDVEAFFQSLLTDHIDVIPKDLYLEIIEHIEDPFPF